MRVVYFIMFLAFLFHLCGKEKKEGLMEISVDIGQDITLPLSTITEELTTIELELTDESMINPDRIRKILLCDNHVIIAETDQMLIFNMKGKFVRSIGSKGQGPGEYISIQGFTFDEKTKTIYIVNNRSQIIGYDLNGKFAKELTIRHLNGGMGGQILGIEYFNNELLLFVESIIEKQIEENETLKCYHSVIYKINDEMQFIDSCFVRDDYFLNANFTKGRIDEYLTYNESAVFLYYPELSSFYINSTPSLSQRIGSVERVLCDTLYRFEHNKLIPKLKLKFTRNGRDFNGDKNILLKKIYQSSRYIFAMYSTAFNQELTFLFCHDTKTGISYNSVKYKDDSNNIEELIGSHLIHPMSNNTELFYYWYTHMNPDDLEEPNPTIYIGKLKK